MPLYDFRCRQCGCIKEVIVSLGELDKAVECVCGTHMTKMVSSSNFSLKGSCWASDGYK